MTRRQYDDGGRWKFRTGKWISNIFHSLNRCALPTTRFAGKRGAYFIHSIHEGMGDTSLGCGKSSFGSATPFRRQRLLTSNVSTERFAHSLAVDVQREVLQGVQLWYAIIFSKKTWNKHKFVSLDIHFSYLLWFWIHCNRAQQMRGNRKMQSLVCHQHGG